MQKHLTFSLALLTLLCTSAHSQLPSYLPADGLVGWWPFNGNANDESGNGNHGTLNGGVNLTTDRFGNVGSAYSFPGNSSSYIECGNSPSLQIINEITLSAWFYRDGGYIAPRILSYEGGFHSEYYMTVSNNSNGLATLDALFVNANGSGMGFCCGNGGNGIDVPALSWHHVLFTADLNNNGRLYLDGQLAAEMIGVPVNQANYINSLNIGRKSQSAYDAWGGLLDDIAIYNRALSEAEIQNLYTANNTGNTVDFGDGAAPLPQGIPYQAAARDAQGQVIADAPVNVRFSLHEGAVDGAVSYSETHALTTNGIGLFNTVFGNGTPEQSAFDSINWAATTKFLQVEIDLGDGYVDMGTTQLLSVPYAFRSDEAARIKNAGLPIFADNTAALAGGLVAGEMYRTATGDLKVVY
jgi:hypothetical protein